MKTALILGLSGLVLAVAACGSDAEKGEVALPAVDCATATVPTYAELTFLQDTCARCHGADKAGSERQEAPESINFDTAAAARPHALKAAEELFEDPPAMPPAAANLPAATEAERAALNAWAQCGTPE